MICIAEFNGVFMGSYQYQYRCLTPVQGAFECVQVLWIMGILDSSFELDAQLRLYKPQQNSGFMGLSVTSETLRRHSGRPC